MTSRNSENLDDLVDTLGELSVLVRDIAGRRGTGEFGVRIAFGQVVRLNSTLHAVGLLIPDGHAGEIMALARVPTEAAIHVKWCGRDAARIRAYQDHAILEAAKLSEAWVRQGAPPMPELAADAEEVRKRRGVRDARELRFPNCADMEQQIWGQTVGYDLLFRRASNDAHASVHAALRALNRPDPRDLSRALFFLLTAGSLLVEAAIETLEWPEYLTRLREVTSWLKCDWTT